MKCIKNIDAIYIRMSILSVKTDNLLTNRLHSRPRSRIRSSTKSIFLYLLCFKNLEKSMVFWYYKNKEKGVEK